MYVINIKMLPKIEILNTEVMRVFRLTEKKDDLSNVGS